MKCRNIVLTLLFVLLCAGCAGAEVLTLPQGLTEIGDEAFFGDYSIRRVILPEGVESIGERAFDRSSITSIRLPSSLKSIADSCFDNTELERIEAEYGTYAYDWAYGYVTSKEGVLLVTPEETGTDDTIKRGQYSGQTIDVLVIGDNIKKIETRAFAYAKIRQLFLPASLEEIEYEAFYNCTVGRVDVIDASYARHYLADARDQDNMEYFNLFVLRENEKGTYSIVYGYGQADDETSFVVPGKAINGTTITTIEENASGCGSKTSLTVQEGIEEIKKNNFTYCDRLKELHLPDSLRIIGEGCFPEIGEAYDEEVVIDLPKGIISLGYDVFDNSGMSDTNAIYRFSKYSDTNEAFKQIENINVRFTYDQHPEWIMRRTGFWQNGIWIPEEIVVIEYRGSAKYVYFPQVGRASIGGYCFYDNDQVEAIYVPEGYIEANSFSYCSNLKEITLPSTLQTSVDPWYCHEDLKIYVASGSPAVSGLEKDNPGRVFTYSFYPELTFSADLTQGDLRLALTYTSLDLFTVNPWPVGPELSEQEKTSILLSFLEKVCETESGKRVSLTSIRLPNLCGEELSAYYFDTNGNRMRLDYTIDTMLVATGKIKGAAFGFSAEATSVVGTTWINYNGTQYVIAPSSPDSIVRSLGAMETILLVDAAKILKDGVTLDLDVYDVFGKNGFIAYLTKIFAEVGIDTTSLQTISQVEKAIESKSDEEYYENLRKLIEIAKGLK